MCRDKLCRVRVYAFRLNQNSLVPDGEGWVSHLKAQDDWFLGGLLRRWNKKKGKSTEGFGWTETFLYWRVKVGSNGPFFHFAHEAGEERREGRRLRGAGLSGRGSVEKTEGTKVSRIIKSAGLRGRGCLEGRSAEG